MKQPSIVIALSLSLVTAGAPYVALAQAALVDGQITKVDEPLKKFDMDGMTMVFRAQDPAMLKEVKAGDKIKFDVDKINGQFTVTKIQKAK
jgi:Cu/Ag efflux protein CusF